jgi:hypothetical protein
MANRNAKAAVKSKPTKKEEGLVATAIAAEALKITPSQFRTIVKAKGIAHDGTYTNPKHRSGPPALLWSRKTIARVRRMKATSEAAGAKGAVRRAAAEAAVDTKRQKLFDLVDSVEITVGVIDPGVLRGNAIEHYNARQRFLDRDRIAEGDSSPEFLDRITMNYIRHELTTYDEHWPALIARVGREEAYQALRDRVARAIADAYPGLFGREA